MPISKEHEALCEKLRQEGSHRLGFRPMVALALAIVRQESNEPLPAVWDQKTKSRWQKAATRCEKLELEHAQAGGLCHEFEYDLAGEWNDIRREMLEDHWCSMIPDAFKIDVEARNVTAQEVVKTNDVDPRRYAALWFGLDCEGWTLRLEVYSHHGSVSIYDDYAMQELWYSSMRTAKTS